MTPPLFQAGRREYLLDEVHLLIDYLGRHRPGRLDACFEDSRGDLPRPAGVPTPPVADAGKPPTKAGFLRRWAEIAACSELAIKSGGAAEPGVVNDVVFLVAARDFLAALAWPASVATIRLTRAYIGEETPPLPAAGAPAVLTEDRDVSAGRRLRIHTKLLRGVCVVLVLLTVAVSLVGFGGKRLIEEQDRLLTFLGTVTSEIGTEQRPGRFDPPAGTLTNVGLTTGASAAGAAPGTATVTTAVAERNLQLAYCDEPFMDANGAVHYRTPRQEILCNRLWGINRVINQLNHNLEAWGNFGPTAYGMLVTGLTSGQSVARVRVFDEAARPLNLREALLLLPERTAAREQAGVMAANATELALARQMVDDAFFEFNVRKYNRELHRVTTGISPTQAKVMIEALSLYIMPCLYALLGAFVAMFQQLKRRADSFTLNRTDGAQAIQTLVFGLVFGALVGILADMLRSRPTSGAASDEVVLGVSVIALIAGYAVAHVFRFLDSFADRMFGAAPKPGEATG